MLLTQLRGERELIRETVGGNGTSSSPAHFTDCWMTNRKLHRMVDIHQNRPKMHLACDANCTGHFWLSQLELLLLTARYEDFDICMR